mmetsp:Transcript_21443/g.83161  ORF Transcript_21443/g.83161 Transcript_21443/m.83161 type:complete len:215 (+) Transcript_21443:45-689(+)
MVTHSSSRAPSSPSPLCSFLASSTGGAPAGHSRPPPGGTAGRARAWSAAMYRMSSGVNRSEVPGTALPSAGACEGLLAASWPAPGTGLSMRSTGTCASLEVSLSLRRPPYAPVALPWSSAGGCSSSTGPGHPRRGRPTRRSTFCPACIWQPCTSRPCVAHRQYTLLFSIRSAVTNSASRFLPAGYSGNSRPEASSTAMEWEPRGRRRWGRQTSR